MCLVFFICSEKGKKHFSRFNTLPCSGFRPPGNASQSAGTHIHGAAFAARFTAKAHENPWDGHAAPRVDYLKVLIMVTTKRLLPLLSRSRIM